MIRLKADEQWSMYSPVDSDALRSCSADCFPGCYMQLEGNAAIDRVGESALKCWTSVLNLQNKMENVSVVYRDNIASE